MKIVSLFIPICNMRYVVTYVSYQITLYLFNFNTLKWKLHLHQMLIFQITIIKNWKQNAFQNKYWHEEEKKPQNIFQHNYKKKTHNVCLLCSMHTHKDTRKDKKKMSLVSFGLFGQLNGFVVFVILLFVSKVARVLLI